MLRALVGRVDRLGNWRCSCAGAACVFASMHMHRCPSCCVLSLAHSNAYPHTALCFKQPRRVGLSEGQIAAAIEERAAARAAKDYAASDAVGCWVAALAVCWSWGGWRGAAPRFICGYVQPSAQPTAPHLVPTPSARRPPLLCTQVRLRLEAAGILIMDTPEGTTWKPGPRLHIAEEENVPAAA